MFDTDKMEAAVLAVLAADPDAWFNHFSPLIVEACDDSLGAAKAVCKELRRKKKVDAQGAGEYAQYSHKR